MWQSDTFEYIFAVAMEVAGLVNGVREVACMLSCFMHGTELRGAVSTSRVLPSPNADYRYLRRLVGADH